MNHSVMDDSIATNGFIFDGASAGHFDLLHFSIKGGFYRLKMMHQGDTNTMSAHPTSA
jgi:hypothetical protein